MCCGAAAPYGDAAAAGTAAPRSMPSEEARREAGEGRPLNAGSCRSCCITGNRSGGMVRKITKTELLGLGMLGCQSYRGKATPSKWKEGDAGHWASRSSRALWSDRLHLTHAEGGQAHCKPRAIVRQCACCPIHPLACPLACSQYSFHISAMNIHGCCMQVSLICIAMQSKQSRCKAASMSHLVI